MHSLEFHLPTDVVEDEEGESGPVDGRYRKGDSWIASDKFVSIEGRQWRIKVTATEI